MSTIFLYNTIIAARNKSLLYNLILSPCLITDGKKIHDFIFLECVKGLRCLLNSLAVFSCDLALSKKWAALFIGIDLFSKRIELTLLCN